MQNEIFPTLKEIGVASEKSRTLYSEKTRDRNNINVWKDDESGVIYMDEFYTGDETYLKGEYREEKEFLLQTGKPNYERQVDAKRRLESNLKFIAGKKLLDFGCGSGDFLSLANEHTDECVGVELEQRYVDQLNSKGIRCTQNLKEIEKKSIDIAVAFHVLEHLPNPLQTLEELTAVLKTDSRVVFEVPHANDFLLKSLECEEFKEFTLWSQHLILHTRESLKRLLLHAGFSEITINGVQRYTLGNHLNWLRNGKAGGHKNNLSLIDTPSLTRAYAESLASIDATDTLIATAIYK